MRKYSVVSLVFIAAVMISMPAYAQSAKEALFGLKKLQARCQAGISYRDYSNAVADAKFPINLFTESAEAKTFPAFTESLKAVMTHYEYAGRRWNEQMAAISKRDPDPVERWLTLGWIPTLGPLGRELTKLYPGIKTGGPKGENYLVDSALETIWATAAQELENTTKLYAKTEGETSSDIDKLKKENEKLKAAAERLRIEEEQRKVLAEYEKVYAENERMKAENEKLKTENENLKKQLELMTPKRKK